MKNRAIAIVMLVLIGIALPVSASAATFLISFNSPKAGGAGPFVGSFTLTTSDTAAADGSYAILNVTGSGTYKTTSYSYSGPVTYNGADNKFFADKPKVFDINGIGLSLVSGASSLNANIFYYSSTINAYMWAVGNDSGIFNTFTVTRLATSVPEPVSWGLMVIGFGLIGCGLRGRPAAVSYVRRLRAASIT